MLPQFHLFISLSTLYQPLTIAIEPTADAHEAFPVVIFHMIGYSSQFRFSKLR